VTSRRRALVRLGAGLLAIPLAARGQPARGLPRVALLHPASAEGSAIYKALVPGLAALGYVDGGTLVLEARSGDGNPEALPGLVADLVGRKVDALIAVGPAAVKAAITATRTIPIVAIDLESDPVQNGWMKSLARPGGNVTGLFLDLTAMSAKWLQLLREAAPAARQISLLWDATTGQAQLAATRTAASAFGIRVRTVSIADWSDFDAAVNAAMQAQTQAFVVLSSPTAFQYSARLAEFTTRRRIPAISPFRPFAMAGGLMSYGPDLDLFFQRTAFMIDRILKGAPASEVPAEQPTRYELVVNLRAAEALGLALPRALLLRADEVVR